MRPRIGEPRFLRRASPVACRPPSTAPRSRTCPDGRLRCPRSPHAVEVWLVVDPDRGEVLGAGRVTAGGAVWLGPRPRSVAEAFGGYGRERYLPAAA
jgi:hypothetical protein